MNPSLLKSLRLSLSRYASALRAKWHNSKTGRRIRAFLTLVVLCSLAPIIALLVHLGTGIPLEPSIRFDLEMAFFQTLIGVFALFIPLIVVAIELLYPRRLVEIQDILKDRRIRLGVVLFLLSSAIPVILVHTGLSDFDDTRVVVIFDMLHVVAVGSMLVLFVDLIRRLDPKVYLVASRTTVQLELRKIKELEPGTYLQQARHIHEAVLARLDRLYDAASVSISTNDTSFALATVVALSRMSSWIEHNWQDLYSLSQPAESLVEHIKKTQSKSGIERHIPELIGEIIWDSLSRIRSILLSVMDDPFMRARLVFELRKVMMEYIDDNSFIVVRAFEHIYDYVIGEIAPDPDHAIERTHRRFIEIIGHHIYMTGSQAYKRIDTSDEKLLESWAHQRPKIMEKCYHFIEPSRPFEEIVVVFLHLLQKVRQVVGDERFQNISEEALFHSSRVKSRIYFEVSEGDIESFDRLFHMWIDRIDDIDGQVKNRPQ